MREWKAAALDGAAMAAAQARWDAVAKPLNSLGLWETWVVRIAGMQGTPDVRIAPRCALVFCADHGVVEEGVSQSGSEVTALVAQSVAEGAANVNLMAAAAGAKAFAVDMGMARDVAHPDMIVLKQAKGTANFTRGPAMPREAAERAVESGADLVARMKERGLQDDRHRRDGHWQHHGGHGGFPARCWAARPANWRGAARDCRTRGFCARFPPSSARWRATGPTPAIPWTCFLRWAAMKSPAWRARFWAAWNRACPS